MLKPIIHSLTIGGVKAGNYFGGETVSLEYVDGLHGKSDAISLSIGDSEQKWRTLYAPDPGTLITAAIGYEGMLPLICGVFESDGNGAAGGGSSVDSFAINGLSIVLDESLRIKRSEGYEKQTLAAIVDMVATRNGLAVIGAVPTIFLERETQRRTSDLEFLTRLAEEHDCVCSIKGDVLVFMPISDLCAAESVFVFDLVLEKALEAASVEIGRILDWTAEISIEGCYGKAEVKYHDGAKNKEIRFEHSASDVLSREVLVIDERADSIAHAEAMCKSKLRTANANYKTATLTLIGHPGIMSGVCVTLGASFGIYAGKYFVIESKHTISSSGYTTALTLQWVQDV